MEEKKDVNTRQSRFSDAAWYQAGPQSIIIGGAGGIGSWVSLFLGRIGHELYIYDDDIIDETNMAGQLYSTMQIGLNKAEATAYNVFAFCGTKPSVLGRYTEEDGFANPIMFSCFDNMAARKLMFEKWAAQEDREVFVDGRA